MDINEVNIEKIKEIEICQNKNGMISIKVGDLKELLFRIDNEDRISIPNHLPYALLISMGIKLKGFHPNKTSLRQEYRLSMDEVNRILPGSFVRTEN